jgi:speckle-type POZ protein
MSNAFASSAGGSSGESSLTEAAIVDRAVGLSLTESAIVARAVGSPVTASAIVARAVGSHILRIDGYSHTKDLGNGKSLTSEKFVIGGHRWYLNYYPDGAGLSSSDWISVFLHLLDHTNADEVKTKFTMSLLDPHGNIVPSHSRTSSLRSFSASGRNGSNSSWGFNEFIRRRDLEESVYLKDDVFTIRCDVTVTEKKAFTKAIPVPPARPGA